MVQINIIKGIKCSRFGCKTDTAVSLIKYPLVDLSPPLAVQYNNLYGRPQVFNKIKTKGVYIYSLFKHFVLLETISLFQGILPVLGI